MENSTVYVPLGDDSSCGAVEMREEDALVESLVLEIWESKVSQKSTKQLSGYSFP